MTLSRIGVVLIGRNEGARLVAALESVPRDVAGVVFVDSGSSDGSVAAARAAGAEVVELDPARPFTAARARNAGLARLCEAISPEYVQFLDGDCQLQPGWLDTALAFLDTAPAAAVACGRRRERFPAASIYNRMCDSEWNTPVGRAKACGGDALIRVSALIDVGGYDPALIAGEEPEMCLRMRALGWEIWRLDAEMTLHDADMHRFSQWWRRTRRTGFAWAEGAAMHGGEPDRHGVSGLLRALGWGLVLPLATLVLTLLFGPWGLALLLLYPLQVLRLTRRTKDFAHAAFLVLGKFPEAIGGLDYALTRLRRRPGRLIEYK